MSVNIKIDIFKETEMVDSTRNLKDYYKVEGEIGK